jgi:hypothetical protein
MCFKEIGWSGLDWIDLSQDVDSRQAAETQYCSIYKIYKKYT